MVLELFPPWILDPARTEALALSFLVLDCFDRVRIRA